MGQTLPHMPQLLGSASRLVHTIPHIADGGEHDSGGTHTLPVQVLGARQADGSQ